MPPSRADVAARIAAVAGPHVLTLINRNDGWPAHADLRLEDRTVPVDVYAAPVGLSHRNRDDIERRFQNPGSGRPITPADGRHPLLLGLWEDDPHLAVEHPVLACADPTLRGRATRVSVFVTVAALLEASERGWSTYVSNSGETIRCIRPELLPTSVEADLAGVAPPTAMVQNAVLASGLAETEDPAAAERARRATTSLVRASGFSRRVLSAYKMRCAMCGLGAGLAEGAHILPASAPGARDEVWNGVALCPNHHTAFDRHLIAVLPKTLEIAISDDLAQAARDDAAIRRFVETTFRTLAVPDDPSAYPLAAMLQQRREYFSDRYRWLQ
ncbi:hypothetical protein GCM10009557_12280 [Virgisporangium ochraceum]|uniref:HNH nuclease domain-containing protein n=1 Tax=Virgisporangium ochraceum TaxID=65505 RepID=A0A8J4A3X9_9ACTN|nr:HNH endonuclease [Virgisporangium ochraceum]GIJ75419.1 hypothetical protein Voc01_103360 [Virgisporangium ochraceum]